jgi:flagellar hook assembly protein FlgD
MEVKVTIYDVRGRLVRKLVDGEKEPGWYQVHWDGRNDRGQMVGSGVYLYRIEAGEFVSTKKMVLVR